MSESRPKAIAFDLDGTLIDSLPGIEFSIAAALKRCEIQARMIDLRTIVGPPIRVILGQLADVSEADLDQLEDAFRGSYDSEGWKKTRVYPRTEAVLATLRDAGLRLFVVTNKPLHISTQILECAKIGQMFERIITRDSRRPPYADKHEMLDDLLNSCNLASTDCLLVGDAEEDGKAAAGSGVRFAQVTYGYGAIRDMPPFPVNFYISEISRLSERIQLELAHDR